MSEMENDGKVLTIFKNIHCLTDINISSSRGLDLTRRVFLYLVARDVLRLKRWR
jgi:hypothetical protein